VIELAVSTGNMIQTTDPAVAAARDAHFLAQGAGSVGDVGMPPVRGGVLRAAADDPAAGHLLPQPRDAGVRLDERLGRGFAVVAREDARPRLGSETLRWCDRLGVRFVATPALDGWLSRHAASAAVVRPDRYVFGVARELADVDTVLGELRRRLGA
jgi:3-(3-hydroxy-phenyl)propionate hydroxylase